MYHINDWLLYLFIILQYYAFCKLILQIQTVSVVKKKELEVCALGLATMVHSNTTTWDIYVIQPSKTPSVKDPVGNEQKKSCLSESIELALMF